MKYEAGKVYIKLRPVTCSVHDFSLHAFILPEKIIEAENNGNFRNAVRKIMLKRKKKIHNPIAHRYGSIIMRSNFDCQHSAPGHCTSLSVVEYILNNAFSHRNIFNMAICLR